MATISLLGTQTFNTTSGTHTVAATPAVGDLIVLVVANSGYTGSVLPTDNNPDAHGTYFLINSALKNSSADLLQFYVREARIGVAASTTFTHAPGTTTGGGLGVFKVTGITRSALLAIRQSAVQANQAASGTPTPVFGSAALTTNPVLGAVFNGTSPATMTPRSSPAYTEAFDVGYSTPTTGLETMFISSGETGTSIAWGGTSASAFASGVVEIDSSAVPLYPIVQQDFPQQRPRHFIEDFIPPNLVIYVVAPSTVVTREPYLGDRRPRKPVPDEAVAPNLIIQSAAAPPPSIPFRPTPDDNRTPHPVKDLSSLDELSFLNVTALPPPFLANSTEDMRRARRAIEEPIKNTTLLLPVSGPTAPPPNPFVDDSRRPRPNRDRDWLSELQFAPAPGVVSLDDARRRLRPPDDWTANTTIGLPTQAAGAPPFIPQSTDDARSRRARFDDNTPNTTLGLPQPAGAPPFIPQSDDDARGRPRADDFIGPNMVARDNAQPPVAPTVPRQYDQWKPPRTQAEDQQQRNLLLYNPPVFIPPPQRADDWSVLRPPRGNTRSEYQEQNITGLLDLPPPPPVVAAVGGGGRHRVPRRQLKMYAEPQAEPVAPQPTVTDAELAMILAAIAVIEGDEIG